jgi:hypothetical protein
MSHNDVGVEHLFLAMIRDRRAPVPRRSNAQTRTDSGNPGRAEAAPRRLAPPCATRVNDRGVRGP